MSEGTCYKSTIEFVENEPESDSRYTSMMLLSLKSYPAEKFPRQVVAYLTKDLENKLLALMEDIWSTQQFPEHRYQVAEWTAKESR